MPREDGPFFGRKAEEYAVEEYGIQLYRQDYYDAIDGTGNKYQVKGASVTVQNPKGERKGRFQLNLRDHKILSRYNEEYIFVLYDPDRSDPVIDSKKIPSREVTDLTDEWAWRDSDGEKKVPWTAIFPDLADELL